MQFGGSRRIFRLGCAYFTFMLGTSAALAQATTQLGQVLGGTGNQQTSCSPTDPSCQVTDQNRNPAPAAIRPGVSPGAVLTDQPENQNATPTTNRLTTNPSADSTRPLDPPTEFQQVVANSIGKMLPIYGARLFRNPPTTFAPLN